MIKRPNNWDNVQEFTDRPKLPLGAYVCRVKQVSTKHTDYGEQLCILFDIAEGQYKDFFKREFDSSTIKDKKWKGVLRQFLPRDDGSDKDELTKRSLKGMVTSFEKSNPGYQWDWDETSLVGKLVGILFRNEEWDYNGKTGWAVRPLRAMSVDSVRNENYTLPEDKPLKKDSAFSAAPATSYSTQFTELEDDDDELPF